MARLVGRRVTPELAESASEFYDSEPGRDRALPHNAEAERTVLGAALVDNTAFNSAAEVLTRDDFHREAHRRIFDAMAALAERSQPIDLVTLKDDLARGSALEAVGGAAYLASLVDGIPRSSNVEQWSRIIKEKAVLRNIIHAGNRIVHSAFEAEEDAGVILDKARAALDSLAAEKELVAGPRHFRKASELIAEPPPAEIIEGVAWAGRITVLVSESGAGKTFVLLDAAALVGGDATRWHGRSVMAGSVAYLSFEGDAIGLRLRALREAKDFTLENVYWRRASDPLSPRIERDGVESCSIGEAAVTEALTALSAGLADEGRPSIVLVVVDTVRASLSGGEDSSEHVSAYLRAVRRIMAPLPGAAAVLAHHAGWLDGESKRKRERGSSAFRGNADATLYLEVVENDPKNHRAYLELRALKVRDAELPAPLRLVRERVDVLGFDAHGQPLRSYVIRSAAGEAAHPAGGRPAPAIGQSAG
jgi:hypothetical protein